MGSFRVGAALGAVLLALVAGCSTKEQGSPSAGGTTTTTTSRTTSSPPVSSPTSPSATSSSSPPVNRPKTIDLKGTTSCKILNAMPAAEFGWAGRTPSEGDSLAFPGTKDCLVNSPASHFVFSVTAVVTQGVAEYTSNGQMPGITPTTIAGFPAFVVPGGVDGCAVTIDVADGQLLDVGWAPTGTQASPPRETQCANATKGAVGAMKVLGAS